MRSALNSSNLFFTAMVPQILDLFGNFSNTSTSNSSTSQPNLLKSPNKVVPLIFICGTAFAILICCIVAKTKHNRKNDDSSDLDDSYNWDSMDDSTRVSRNRDEKILEHNATCHDHRSHYKYQPQLHGGHYDLNEKNFTHRSDHEYQKVNTGGGTV